MASRVRSSLQDLDQVSIFFCRIRNGQEPVRAPALAVEVLRRARRQEYLFYGFPRARKVDGALRTGPQASIAADKLRAPGKRHGKLQSAAIRSYGMGSGHFNDSRRIPSIERRDQIPNQVPGTLREQAVNGEYTATYVEFVADFSLIPLLSNQKIR